MEHWRANVIIRAVLLLTLGAFVGPSYSRLVYPKPYNTNFDPNYSPSICSNARGPACPLLKSPVMENAALIQSIDSWKRGQRVTITWTEGESFGGFIRLSIVPRSKMFDHDFQKKTAFQYACFAQRHYSSGNHIFDASVQIPTNIPDGDYVFAFAKYGCLSYASIELSPVPDLYSCSFITISGGSMEISYQPRFDADIQNGNATSCMAITSEPGKCTRTGDCQKNDFDFVRPTEFQGGNVPPAIPQSVYT